LIIAALSGWNSTRINLHQPSTLPFPYSFKLIYLMKNILIFILNILSISYALNAQSRYYVNASATGVNNGQSWSDAFQDLQSALQTAQSGDEVWVAEGTYRPTTTTDRSISFEPKSGVKLYGGFAGIEADLGQRDLALYPSVLNGDIGVPGDSTDNALNVLYLFQPDSNTVVDGFTVCHGLADNTVGAGSARDRAICGGGLYIDAGNWDAFPNIQNCRFWRNAANEFGGAVMLNGTSASSVAPRFVNCIFEENHTLGSGGGLARFGGSWTERGKEFEDCHFLKNHAVQGGGLYYSDTKGPNMVSLQGCTFAGNMAVFNGGGAFFQTGKVGISGLYIETSTFEANDAFRGSAIVIFTNGSEFDGVMLLDSCIFFRNTALMGVSTPSIILTDQFSTSETVLKLSNSIFIENYSLANIISFSWVNSEMLIRNVLFEKNKSGGIISQGDLSGSEIKNTIFRLNECSTIGVHSFYGSNTTLKISNCLFEKNKTTNINGLFNLSLQKFIVQNSAFLYEEHPMGFGQFIFSGSDSSLLFNTIITDSITKWSFGGGSTLFLSHNSFGFIDCNDQFPNVTCGPGNLIGLDPMFRDSANGDYSLLPCSPLINAGSNAAAAGLLTDLAGNPRIQGGTVDIGAYESPAFSLAAEPVVKPACVGESNGSISISPVFGCEPYIYNWSPQAGTGPELSGLLPGSYLLTLTDGSGRQILDTVQVSTSSLPELSTSSTDVDCTSGLGGSITALVSNGAAPYQYQWLPAAADTAYLGQLPPGNYALTVTDINGCRDSASASLALQGLLSLMVDGQIIRCFGETGWLSATPVTGIAPYTWAWTGWPGTDALAEPLGPGNYSVTVTDAYGCTSSKTFPPMTEPGLLTLGTGSSDQTQTNPPNGAAVVTTISGGTAPFGYQWDMGSTAQAIGGLVAGTYTVTVTDKNGCEAVAEVVVDLMVGTGEAAGRAVLMYPNPAADWVRVLLPEGINSCTVEISDASGRVLRSTTLPHASVSAILDLSGLPGGNYWVMLRNGEVLFVGKLMKR